MTSGKEELIAEMKVYGRKALYHIEIYAKWVGKQIRALVVWAWKEGAKIGSMLHREYPVIAGDIKTALQKVDGIVEKFVKEISGVSVDIPTPTALSKAL